MIEITFDYQDEFNETKTVTVSNRNFEKTKTISPLAILQLEMQVKNLINQVTPCFGEIPQYGDVQ